MAKKRTNSTISQLLHEQKNKCNRCKKSFDDMGSFHIDHIKPLSKGGKDTVDNMQILCVKCHSIKTKEDGFNNSLIKENLYYSECAFCDKVVRGYNKDQTDYMLNQHILSRHPEKIKIKKSKSPAKISSQKRK